MFFTIIFGAKKAFLKSFQGNSIHKEMKEGLMRGLLAERIGGQDFDRAGGYKMEEIKAAKRRFQAEHPDRVLLDMGIGEPDLPPPDSVIEELCSQAHFVENQGYADNGCPEFREAATRFIQKTFGVTVDSQTELAHCIGAKSALSLMPLCLINSGDLIIATHPVYPIFNTHVEYLGGEVFSLPLLWERQFLPDLSLIPTDVARRAKVFHVNYPNNPTSAPATSTFFVELIEFAHHYDIAVINDAAYACLTEHPRSILQCLHAKDIAIEIHSMSKTYNMTGWRLGWVCGNADLVSAFSKVKDYSDSGQFLAIQKAAIQALEDCTFSQKMTQRYQQRKQSVAAILKTHGFEVYSSDCGFFLYVRVPQKLRYQGQEISVTSAAALSQWLLEALGIVSVPWEDPEPSIRFSMTFRCTSEEEFYERLTNRLKGIKAA
ncbi:MAG: aminotransferase class I/II-fold pyridoxal phosphate-dependent enzyme [Verrucomicrobiota bacterium]|nr:MAG: aminotransferase class I/II-fold pyridoxal phosphate-dependent enzyme [Verrucomicrobiota bacterium]